MNRQRGKLTKLCGICGEPSKDALPHVECVDAYTLPKLAKLAQIEYRTAHIWMKRGLLKPSIRATEGTGHPALFSFEDVKHARTLAMLREFLTVEALEAVAQDASERERLRRTLALL